MQKIIAENDLQQNENIQKLQEELEQCQNRLKDLEENVLYYQYDDGTKTLNVYGNRGGQESE